MTVKYKVSDFAKDLNLSAKKVLDELAAMAVSYTHLTLPTKERV